MINSRIIDILKTFSKKDLKNFGYFLHSPYHNKNKKAVSLFEILTRYHPEYSHKDLTKEKIYYRLFKYENKFNDAVLRNIFSDLILLSEEFLSFERFKNDTVCKIEKGLTESNERNLSSVFESFLRTADKYLKNADFDGEKEFHFKSELENMKFEFSRKNDDLKLHKSTYLRDSSIYITSYYLLKAVKSLNFTAFQNQLNVKDEFDFTKNILNTLNREEFLKCVNNISERNHSIMNVYFNLFESITDVEDDEKYFKLKESFFANSKIFSPLEKYGLYIYLANICVMKIDLRKEEFKKECFSVYKEMIRKDLFSVMPGYFPISLFTAVINTGMAAGDLSSVKNFIDKFSGELNPDHRVDAVNYFNALLKFSEKKFNESLELISRVETGFSNFKYLTKILSMKCYFELEDYEQVYYISDSFLHFLNNNKYVDEIYKTEFKKFIKILDLIIKYRSDKSEDIFLNIEKKMTGGFLSNRNWIKEKLLETDRRFEKLN